MSNPIEVHGLVKTFGRSLALPPRAEVSRRDLRLGTRAVLTLLTIAVLAAGWWRYRSRDIG